MANSIPKRYAPGDHSADCVLPPSQNRPLHENHRQLPPLHPLDLAVDRYRFQFEMIASYLTGFLISGVGFGPEAAANSRAAASGACGRSVAAVVAAASKAIATNAVIVR
jgi:hypothetical protein